MNVDFLPHADAHDGPAPGPIVPTSGRRFKCPAPGCSKDFTRKEHLTRHAKSHNPRLQHQCPICGRGYARSDVLKRHIEFHPLNSRPNPRPRLAACVSCHERKLKCGEETPCPPCVRNGIDCIRSARGQSPNAESDEPALAATADTDQAFDGQDADADAEMTSDLGQVLADTTNRDTRADTVGPWSGASDGPEPWFNHDIPQPQYDWSLPSLSPLPPILAHDGQHEELTQWPMASNPFIPHSSTPRGSGLVNLTVTPETASSSPGGNSGGTNHTFSSVAVSPNTVTSPPTSVSPGRKHGDTNQTLGIWIRRDLPTTTHLVQVFFAEIHPYWPILHVSTFEAAHASDMLLGAMLMLSSWITGGQVHVEIAPLVIEEVMAATSPESMPSLHTLQALLLCVVYAIYCRREQTMLAKAIRLNAILVSTCRCLDIFSGHHALPERMDQCAFTFWLAKEQLHRLAFSVFRVDTYLSILLDHPPSVRYQEIVIPLPKSSQLWTAASEEERRRLQWDEPAGREKALFAYLMRDALLDSTDTPGLSNVPYRLNSADYHLGLCALQGGIWEAAREAHSAASDEIVTKLEPGSPIRLWRSHLLDWRTRMLETITSPTNPDAVLTPLTLTLWHISAIRMHAPVTLLRVHGALLHQGYGGGGLNLAASTVYKPKAHLHRWLASLCPRSAVWSAAQIARLLTLESEDAPGASVASARRLQLNPLAVPGLLMSAIVTCSYASQILACPSCLPGSAAHTAAVDVFVGGDEDQGLARWKQFGEGWAVWGATGIAICRCQLAALGEWFLRALARDQGAQREFESFFESLT